MADGLVILLAKDSSLHARNFNIICSSVSESSHKPQYGQTVSQFQSCHDADEHIGYIEELGRAAERRGLWEREKP